MVRKSIYITENLDIQVPEAAGIARLEDELRQRRPVETREGATGLNNVHPKEGIFFCDLQAPGRKRGRNKHRLLRRFAGGAALLYTLTAVAFFAYRNVELSPICSLPGIGIFGLPYCTKSTPESEQKDGLNGAGDFSRLVKLQSGFQGVLESSAGGSSLAMDLRGSEIVVKELRKLVLSSGLECKDALSTALDEFSDTAKSASSGLMRFDSRVSGVVDYLISIDKYALRALSAVQTRHLELNSGKIINSWSLALFRPFYGAMAEEKDVLMTFIKATSVMDTGIRELVMEAEQVLRELHQLENQLGVITNIASSEKERMMAVVKVLDDWARRISPYFGRQAGEMYKNRQKYDAHYALLTNVIDVSEKAINHVDTAVIKLRQMQAQLEDLRDRVAKPALLSDAGIDYIPLEIHLENIMLGVERLSAGKVKAQEIENEARERLTEMRAKVSGHE